MATRTRLCCLAALLRYVIIKCRFFYNLAPLTEIESMNKSVLGKHSFGKDKKNYSRHIRNFVHNNILAPIELIQIKTQLTLIQTGQLLHLYLASFSNYNGQAFCGYFLKVWKKPFNCVTLCNLNYLILKLWSFVNRPFRNFISWKQTQFILKQSGHPLLPLLYFYMLLM